MTKYTFKEFQAEYPDDAACLTKLMEINYGGTDIFCPGCGIKSQFHMMSKRRAFACQECGRHVYPCAETIFHKSSTKLTIWFFAMYLMTSTRHGVAAKEIERQTGVTYKCAWRICHELRKLMASADVRGPLRGHVEADETHIGGRQKRRAQRMQGSNKTIVMGIVERGGKILAGPVPSDAKAVLEPIISANVEIGSELSTDEHVSY
jgi:transposase